MIFHSYYPLSISLYYDSRELPERFSFPVIVKVVEGSDGVDVYLSKNQSSLKAIAGNLLARNQSKSRHGFHVCVASVHHGE